MVDEKMNENGDSLESLEASLKRLQPVAFDGSAADVMFAAGEQSGWEKAQAQLQRKSSLLIGWQLATAASLMLACFSTVNWVRETPAPSVAQNHVAEVQVETAPDRINQPQDLPTIRTSPRTIVLKPQVKSESAIGLRNAMVWDQIQPFSKSSRERLREQNDLSSLYLSRSPSMVAKQIQNSILETNDDY